MLISVIMAIFYSADKNNLSLSRVGFFPMYVVAIISMLPIAFDLLFKGTMAFRWASESGIVDFIEMAKLESVPDPLMMIIGNYKYIYLSLFVLVNAMTGAFFLWIIIKFYPNGLMKMLWGISFFIFTKFSCPLFFFFFYFNKQTNEFFNNAKSLPGKGSFVWKSLIGVVSLIPIFFEHILVRFYWMPKNSLSNIYQYAKSDHLTEQMINEFNNYTNQYYFLSILLNVLVGAFFSLLIINYYRAFAIRVFGVLAFFLLTIFSCPLFFYFYYIRQELVKVRIQIGRM